MHHFGSRTRGCKYLSHRIQPLSDTAILLQPSHWLPAMDSFIFILFIDEACIFAIPRNILFISFWKSRESFSLGCRPAAGAACWCVHVQSKIIDQSSPCVICIHTTLDGNKIKFFICLPTHTHAVIDPRNADLNVLIICVTALEWVCEHYGLYGGCHVTSPLDYYIARRWHSQDKKQIPSTITFAPLGGGARTQRSLEHNWSGRQMSVWNKFIQNNREHLCWRAVVTPISGNGDIKWCCNTNNGSRPPWHWAGHGASSPQQRRLPSPQLQRKLNKQSAFDTMSFKHVGIIDVHNLL